MKKIIILSAFLASSAVGVSGDFYIGSSLGTTASTIDTAVDHFKSDEMGLKVYLGWDLLKFLGAEASYRDLGNFSEGSTNGSINVDLKVIDLSARVFLPIGKRFHLFAKAGYAQISTDGDFNNGGSIENINEDDTKLFYGIGTEFNVGKNFAIRAEWEMFDVSNELSTLSAGLLFRF